MSTPNAPFSSTCIRALQSVHQNVTAIAQPRLPPVDRAIESECRLTGCGITANARASTQPALSRRVAWETATHSLAANVSDVATLEPTERFCLTSRDLRTRASALHARVADHGATAEPIGVASDAVNEREIQACRRSSRRGVLARHVASRRVSPC